MKSLALSFLALSATLAWTAEPARLLRYPDVHGTTVVFTCADDLWKADLRTGEAQRLTSDPGFEGKAKLSPDGTQVVFSANYDGTPDLYIMPLAGGVPQRLTYDPESETVAGWTPGGKIAYASTAGSYTFRQTRLWLVDSRGGLPERTRLDEFATGAYFPDGRLAYNRTSSYTINWRGYRGGLRGKISLYDPNTNRYSELITGPENDWFPMVAGNSLYYLSDRSHATANLYKRDLATNQDTAITHYTDYEIKNPSTDGKTIVYEHDGELHAYEIGSGRDIVPAIHLSNDAQPVKPFLQKVGDKIEDFDLSPDGKRAAVVARGDVFVISVATGEAQNLTASSGSRERCPRWSGDGNSILYLSDETGDYELMSRALDESEPKRWTHHSGASLNSIYPAPEGTAATVLTQDGRAILVPAPGAPEHEVFRMKYGPSVNLDWSPDGRWIAYSTTQPNAQNAVFLYEVATGRRFEVSTGLYDDRNPVFDRSGNYLYFVSTRKFNPTAGHFTESLKVEESDQAFVLPLRPDLPNPLVPTDGPNPGDKEAGIDPAELQGKEILLPVSARDIIALLPAKGGVFIFSSDKLIRFDLDRKKADDLYSENGLNFSFSPAADKIIYYVDNKLGVVDGSGPFSVGQGKVDTGGLQLWVNPREEWRQIFWETWRFERDNFYRSDMGGIDWKSIGGHYAGLVASANSRSDVGYIQRLLISELGTSHAYADDPALPSPPADRNLKPAFLGVDYAPEGSSVRIKRILQGTLALEGLRGPLGEPGIKAAAGNYLISIDGTPVNSGTNPGKLLLGKADRPVVLTLNDRPGEEGSWTVKVRPIRNESSLRYYEWVEGNRRLVDRLSGGRIAYIHYPGTRADGQTEFLRTFYGQSDKDALILDGRFNSGGKPQPMVLQEIAHRQQNYFIHRFFEVHSDIPAINGPKAMLINGYAGSGGDLTPYMFREAGLGKLIGMPTYGALVGLYTDDLTLVDGGSVSAPSFARFDFQTGEQIAENQGIQPDVRVDARPDLLADGHDPQLEAAVKDLLAELAKQPKKPFKPRYVPGIGERRKG